MKIDKKEIWLNAGYEIFAHQGTEGLKVEVLAKKVGISKSSFYHYFADLEIFIDSLLKKHLEISKVIAEKESKCLTIDPELISVLIEHKNDLLFNRQLRIKRHERPYYEILNKSNQTIGNSFITVWIKDQNLKLSMKQLEGLFELALENFFLKITNENLNYPWLSKYFLNLKRVTENFSN